MAYWNGTAYVEAPNPNTAFYCIYMLYTASIIGATALAYWMNTSTKLVSFGIFSVQAEGGSSDTTKNWIGAGSGLGSLVFFFSMGATLFSGYSVSGIANEAYATGFLVTRWIVAGVTIYACFMLLAPRLHALGKSHGYLSVIEFIFDRYAFNSSHPLWAHTLRMLSLGCLQLPVFCYLISQFSSAGIETARYTQNEISSLAGVLIAAITVLFLDFFGGFRAVCYTDVVQGIALMWGCFVFFIIQRTNFGGLPKVNDYVISPNYLNVTKAGYSFFNNVPAEQGSNSVTTYASFVIQTCIAATMFPHLVQRLFVAKDAKVLKMGLSGMNVCFFFIQLSSMITGWVAVGQFLGKPRTEGVFASVCVLVRDSGSGGQFASALLLSAALCAMMSTADSALIAFSTMWLKDFYLPYVNPKASYREQMMFVKAASLFGWGLGLFLTLMSIFAEPAPWNLSNLFTLQSVTPIHVAPSVWFGLHWRGLRAEPVVLGQLAGLAVTFGFLFNPNLNVKYGTRVEETKEGWSSCVIGLCFNVIVTVVGGLILDYFPNLLPASDKVPANSRPLDIHKVFGEKRDKMLNPLLWSAFIICSCFLIPFYRKDDFGKRDTKVEYMTTWAFVSLVFAALITILTFIGFYFFWQDYDIPEHPSPFIPWSRRGPVEVGLPATSDVKTSDEKTSNGRVSSGLYFHEPATMQQFHPQFMYTHPPMHPVPMPMSAIPMGPMGMPMGQAMHAGVPTTYTGYA